MTMHLAQLNIAVPRYPLGDPRIADFVDNLDLVNGIAEKMPGFVWRFTDESGNATSVEAGDLFGNPDVIINMSVWESAEALEKFVWQTVHKRFYNRKAEWFDAMASQHFVMWYVTPNHKPTLTEAANRLKSLNASGSTDYAFGWNRLPDVKLWQSQRCA